MFELIRENQLNIMLLLCGACAAITLLLVITRFISNSRKNVLILMEVIAFFLLWFDRLAYIYSGVETKKGYNMVRVSNFAVFFLTSAIVCGFNMYLIDWLKHEGGMKETPGRLKFVAIVSTLGMLLSIVSAFTGLYYYFDSANRYHRGSGFLIAYIIPVVCPIVQYTVILQKRKLFSRIIYVSLNLYIFVPIVCGIVQIFAYGISIVNMSMVLVSIFLYIFTYIDINDEVERVHESEMDDMKQEQNNMRRLFDQTATAFVKAVERKDDFAKGHSERVATYARRIAEIYGKNEEECERVYYAALLHDVGIIGVPDNVIKNEANPDKWDYEVIRKKPEIGREILSDITEYPYLSQAAYYSHERYNGTGYPEGLSGKDIPEIARIVAVADAFATMTSKKRYRDAKPEFVARETFVKGAGEEFDPEFAKIMVKIIDADSDDKQNEELLSVPEELHCNEYRDAITPGIEIDREKVKITFDCEPSKEAKYSAPSIILFESFDKRVHNNAKTIAAYYYLEYAEAWFDNNVIDTAARKIEVTKSEEKEDSNNSHYEIVAARYEDHLRLRMTSPTHMKEMIVALPSGSKGAYIGLTGEHCDITNINVEQTGECVGTYDIPRIADEISYIDRIESDVKNIQIDRTRSATTMGIEIEDKLQINFHTMSLPDSKFVWHCPYIVIFYSDNQTVGGPNYREYALIKLNGENEVKGNYAENRFVMKRKDSFPGWEEWKAVNQKGMECEVVIERSGNRVVTHTENLGIEIENTTTISELMDNVYVALTGDQCALTDIRLK
ncbi:MAG: HD domain-containing protein [Lachnospiraceae bacterium]|jgi:HD-GYP domain-containing protein (c-di-GMP phosphodiesterase class II)|nr:HD domain-containing protein [Lachnospiraceae bacterium]